MTKKIGSAGRFGVRYGRTIREKVVQIEKKLKSKHTCPKCQSKKAKRIAKGIWKCQKCSYKFAGKAYEV